MLVGKLPLLRLSLSRLSLSRLSLFQILVPCAPSLLSSGPTSRIILATAFVVRASSLPTRHYDCRLQPALGRWCGVIRIGARSVGRNYDGGSTYDHQCACRD